MISIYFILFGELYSELHYFKLSFFLFDIFRFTFFMGDYFTRKNWMVQSADINRFFRS
jgi:hypothetical protein